MCTGIEIAMLASAAVSATGAVVQGVQAKEQADNQSREREYAAEQSRADADAAAGYAQVRADKIRKAGAMQQSQARSSLAKSGVVADAGTAETIQDFIGTSSEEDALSEIRTGQSQASRLRMTGATQDRESGYLTQAGDNAMTSGILGAGKSVLGAYASYKNPGWKYQATT